MLESPADEAARLRRCLGDLVGITALPALWAGAEPARIAATLLDALHETLPPGFVFVRLEDPRGGPPVEMARAGPPLERAATAREIGALLERALGASPSRWPAGARVPLGGAELCVAVARLGLGGELGVVAAGCGRPGFPGRTERLLLDVAAGQAAVGLHQAHLLGEQKRVAGELGGELAREAEERRDERKRAEDALRRSERGLKLIIDTMPALAWSTGPDGSADFFNQHYLDYVGLSAAEVGGWGWTAALHPEDVGGLAATWQRIMESGAEGEAEARLRRHDGEYRWFLFRASPLHDESGAIVRWYGVNTDIEDRKRAEAELRRAYDSFADAQRLSRTGSFITDLVGDDHNWSEQAYRIFEFEPGSRVTVQRIREMIHPDDLPPFEAMIARAMTGVNVDFAFRIATARGALKHVRGVAHVVEQVEGRPMFVGALQDVTETVVAEEALNRARSELAHVARVATMSALTASIAHEVNQPLSGIITNASTCVRMLDADPPNVDGARETARRTIRDGHRASDVITRLRALFSRKELALEPLDLNEAVREVVALSLGELQASRVVLQPELTEGLPPVTGDRVQLQQVVLNLLRNASDAMAGVEDRQRHLLVRTELEGGDRVRVTVRDTGVGIDPGSADKLFDAFYTTKSGGMGIGLSVSRSIVESHQGRLWAEPNDGPGATFAFSLPCRPEAGADAASGSARTPTDT